MPTDKYFSEYCDELFLFISIPPENVSKTKGFLMFSGGTEIKHWDKNESIKQFFV